MFSTSQLVILHLIEFILFFFIIFNSSVKLRNEPSALFYLFYNLIKAQCTHMCAWLIFYWWYVYTAFPHLSQPAGISESSTNLIPKCWLVENFIDFIKWLRLSCSHSACQINFRHSIDQSKCKKIPLWIQHHQQTEYDGVTNNYQTDNIDLIFVPN